MEARIVSLPTRPDPSIRVDGERILVDRLTLVDPAQATWLGGQPEGERAIIVERALRIGLTALQSVGVTLNLDAVRSEFDRFAEQNRSANDRAAEALEQVLRANFGDVEGRLPRTLETFLGDRGKLQSMVDELFDPKRRDSAIGRMTTMLETYFDGDASRLATLLDPTRMGSPLHQFRTEVAAGFRAIEEKLVAIEAASTARAGRSKKGDFVLTLDPAVARGTELRVVVEAKDRKVTGREMRDELREARTNRDAAVGLVVFTPSHAPSGIAPFDVRAGDVYCVIDPAEPDSAILEAAVRLARLLALASLREHEAEVDAATLVEALTGIREQLEAVRAMKTNLTQIGSTATAVAGSLDRMREGILAQIVRAERELVAASA
ncbi:MAG: hypothetical protein HYX54_08690 [Chloroflexi bacterium]|nr:hypothetical protein [Chloroflexota bacterium]